MLDHLLYTRIEFIFNDSGLVYSCGTNDAQQLGHGNMKIGAILSAPSLTRTLKTKSIKLIGAGRYHTAVSTVTQVFSFGKNLGQLGYEKTSNNYQASSRPVNNQILKQY